MAPATTPKLGISFSFQAHRGLGEPYDKAYREALELAAEASGLGYHSVWIAEHHFVSQFGQLWREVADHLLGR